MSRSAIAVLDIGIGNSATVIQMLRTLDYSAEAIKKPESLRHFDKVILPGVGSWSTAVTRLEQNNWREALNFHVDKGNGLLGICLGFQLLFEKSEEGEGQGLGILAGQIKKIDSLIEGVQTNVGWMEVSGQLCGRGASDTRFYFSHQYCLPASEVSYLEIDFVRHRPQITASARQGNVFGAQFHPERSLKFGMGFLDSFAGEKL